MPLNKCKGNMYGFITHTWNTIKGKCYHDCSYCYMKRFKQSEIHFDEKELKTNLGDGNFIFVGSSNDMFADYVLREWVNKTLQHCYKHNFNQYLFQTKSPVNLYHYENQIPRASIICTTLETNRYYKEFMGYTPIPRLRTEPFGKISDKFYKHITIEPIMDFDLTPFVEMIKICEPVQVNIGADSGGHKLPEPSAKKIGELIFELEKFTTVYKKKNLKRIFK